MGRDKALLPLGGKPLIEHVLERVSGLGDEILITTNKPDEYAFLGLRMVADHQPGAGALDGLLTALEAARCERVLLLACDMPFVSRPLLDHMLGIDSDSEVVIPRREGKLQPLHAIYATSCAASVREALGSGEKRMISFFPSVQTWIVEQEILDRYDPNGLSFFNVNTPDDLEQAEQTLGTLGP